MRDEQKKTAEENGCEIIELAIDELELLTRAFTVIDQVCREMENPRPMLCEAPGGKVN